MARKIVLKVKKSRTVFDMKKLLSSLPADVKQTLASLAVATALLCSSLFMLSSYMDSIRESGSDVDVMATLPEESTEVPD